jgi:membrane protein DedA with SNARE-associated domain
MDIILHWIAQYGYPALFALLMLGIVGLPVPDETILTFAGYLVFKNELALIPTVVVAFLGSICGITISYGMGRSLGPYLARTVGHALRIRPEDLEQVRAWYVRWGKYTLVLGYFVPGVRHLAALVAGSSKLPLTVFMPFAYTGGLIWSGTFIALGYALGEEWGHTSSAIHRLLAIGAGAVFVTLAILFVRRMRRTP